MGDEETHWHRACSIRPKSYQLRSEDDSPGAWVPSAEVTQWHCPSVTVHPLSWAENQKGSREEADRFALAGAVWWIENKP